MKKYFLTGLVILLPLAVTVAIVIFIVNFLTEPFIGAFVNFLSRIQWNGKELSSVLSMQLIYRTSQIIILILIFVFILILGMVARWFFFRSLIKFSDSILHKIPLVNKIYKTSQEIINTFFKSDSKSFKRVVLVPFPKEDVYCLGLVSRDAPQMLEDAVKEKLISVFVPTTPNPTSGFILMFKEEDVIDLDIKTEEALKFIVSCGVIHPEGMQKQVPQEEA
ncbi:MAG: hypothetical protein K940chlam8_01003 [Chlamydiae bacterium]|nr:hypothetical protein [Chlamydiota bacterium]